MAELPAAWSLSSPTLAFCATARGPARGSARFFLLLPKMPVFLCSVESRSTAHCARSCFPEKRSVCSSVVEWMKALVLCRVGAGFLHHMGDITLTTSQQLGQELLREGAVAGAPPNPAHLQAPLSDTGQSRKLFTHSRREWGTVHGTEEMPRGWAIVGAPQTHSAHSHSLGGSLLCFLSLVNRGTQRNLLQCQPPWHLEQTLLDDPHLLGGHQNAVSSMVSGAGRATGVLFCGSALPPAHCADSRECVWPKGIDCDIFNPRFRSDETRSMLAYVPCPGPGLGHM